MNKISYVVSVADVRNGFAVQLTFIALYTSPRGI